MPVIKLGTRKDGNIEGADYGASISLIFDESDPGQGPRLHRHPYDETWSSRRDISPSSAARSASRSVPATS